MTKRQLIKQIQDFNREVPPRFLTQFDQAALRQYLDHLKVARERSVRVSRWVRPVPALRMVS